MRNNTQSGCKLYQTELTSFIYQEIKQLGRGKKNVRNHS